ncbi:MAG: hypothetical protein WDA60_04460 [Acidimicrobiia bacterium]
MNEAGDTLGITSIDNDPNALVEAVLEAGPNPPCAPPPSNSDSPGHGR